MTKFTIPALKDAYHDRLPNVPIYGTGKGDRNILKSAIDLDKEILSHSSATPKEQENTGFLDPCFYLFTSGTTGVF